MAFARIFFSNEATAKIFWEAERLMFQYPKRSTSPLCQRIFYMMSEGMFMLLFLNFMNMFFRWVAQPSEGYVSQAGTLEAASLVVKQSIPSKFGWPLVLRHESDSKFWICVFIWYIISMYRYIQPNKWYKWTYQNNWPQFCGPPQFLAPSPAKDLTGLSNEMKSVPRRKDLVM